MFWSSPTMERLVLQLLPKPGSGPFRVRVAQWEHAPEECCMVWWSCYFLPSP